MFTTFSVIENLQNHIIFEFWIFLFDEILPIIKKAVWGDTRVHKYKQVLE
jgi:hypothetical protein